MPQARLNPPAQPPIFRLDNALELDLKAIEMATAKPQHSAWRYLASIFATAVRRHSTQLSIEPDTHLWRLRYRTVDSFDEQLVENPSVLICALDALQIQLWGEAYHQQAQRSTRFTWSAKPHNLSVNLRVVRSVNGDVLQFDIEQVRPLPPLLDELGLEASQLRTLRQRLQHQHGMILITSPEPDALNDTLLAINQELISPERKLLSFHHHHRYHLPRTVQIDLPNETLTTHAEAVRSALDTFHDVVLFQANLPAHLHESIANNCDQGVLAIQATRVSRAADSINMLNANILRRSPLHRAVNTVLNHYPVRTNCIHCAERAELNTEEQHWLERRRTPVTENVIRWLTDGNTEQFVISKGCERCAHTGCGQPIAVFDIVHRDESNHQFPSQTTNATAGESIHPLQAQLMALAKAGKITLSEVIRVLEQAGMG